LTGIKKKLKRERIEENLGSLRLLDEREKGLGEARGNAGGVERTAPSIVEGGEGGGGRNGGSTGKGREWELRSSLSHFN